VLAMLPQGRSKRRSIGERVAEDPDKKQLEDCSLWSLWDMARKIMAAAREKEIKGDLATSLSATLCRQITHLLESFPHSGE
jgi:hypothetical protein